MLLWPYNVNAGFNEFSEADYVYYIIARELTFPGRRN